MSSSASPIQVSLPRLQVRSMGAKFFIVMFLAFLMSISGFFVYGLAVNRADNHGLWKAVENESPQPKTVMGVQLVDSYRSTMRSVHYITLFLGLVFLTYFLFEVKTRKRVHPAQYAMVGVAQTIFYLLLLSLAEHLGFDWSFLIAGASTVALLASNTEWVFRSRALAMRALVTFSAVYAFIYVLLRVEAYALLVGAVVSFAAIAAAMYMTRNVDWYAGGGVGESVGTGAGGGGPQVRESWLR